MQLIYLIIFTACLAPSVARSLSYMQKKSLIQILQQITLIMAKIKQKQLILDESIKEN